ncbi:MAG: DNA polymerase III subunit gamma/tau [Pyrinomonadaceae bacterium]
MSYQVIARKWRPQTFEEVTGQEAITRTLRNAVEHDRLHHAYIFSGARGVGKTTTARLLAKSLNCHKTDKPNPTPCTPTDADACASCKEIAESRSIDVLEFDAASHTGVDDIRELIIESININPARDRYKIFIIDEVHMLSNSSFNALLKTLEEPPPNVEFIMATTELHKVPDTILSRCQEFQFRTIPLQKIYDRLHLIAETEKINIADGALREIARSGEGSMRDAQSNFDQVISFSGESIEINDVVSALGVAITEMLTTVVKAIAENTPSVALITVDELISRGQDLRSFCRDLLSLFRDLLIAKMAGDAEHLFDSALMSIDELRNIAEPFSEADLIRFFNSLSDTESKLRDATQPRYLLEIGLVKIIEMRRVAPLEQIIERLAKLENALSNGNLNIETANDEKIDSAAPPTTEKKKLAVDFPPGEVPFPVSETAVQSSRFNVQSSDEENFSESIEVSKPNQDNIETTVDFSENRKIENSFETEISSGTENSFSQSEISDLKFENQNIKPETLNLKPETNLVEIIANMPSKLPPISSEELEHIEDNKLYDAYEMKLQKLGDNLYPIKNASKIVEVLLGENHDGGVSATIETPSNGNGTAAAPARQKTVFEIPVSETEDETLPLPELSDDPTEEELWHYAESHPLTKKLIRIFRGKLVEVKKL